MKTGKISEAILNRSVIKEIKYKNDCMQERPHSGRDAAKVSISGKNISVTSNPVVLNCELDAYLGISRVLNDITAAGGVPKALTAVLLLPTGYTEARLKKLMRRIDYCCEKNDVVLAGGHTEVTPLVNAPCTIFTAVGEASDWIPSPEAGHEIIMTNAAALEGTYIMTMCRKEDILKRYSETYYDKCLVKADELFTGDTAKKAAELGASYIHNLSCGGVYNGLWELAQYCKMGLTADLKKIPVRQETIELCELFELNPYQMASNGSLLITAPAECRMAEKLKEYGTAAQVIGILTASNDRIIRNDDEQRFLEEPKSDEILRLFSEKG